jgi:hypothetical protein
VNKFNVGDPLKSSLMKEMLKTKNLKTVKVNIKNKLEEIEEKLKKYEDAIKNLGKDFTSLFK